MTDQDQLDGMPPPSHEVTITVAGTVLHRWNDPAGIPRIGDAIRLPQKQTTVTRVTRTAGKDGAADAVAVVVAVDRVSSE